MVDPNKKPGTKSLNQQAWERLLDHSVSELRVEWVEKPKKKGKFSGPPVQACWVTSFVPDSFHAELKGKWESDLELRGDDGAVVATAKLQPKAAAAAMVIPEPPLLKHRGALKSLPAARVWVWAMALEVLPQDLQWQPKGLSSDERFVLQHFRSNYGAALVHPGELLDEYLAWEEAEAERDRRAKAKAEEEAKAKAQAVNEAMELLLRRGVTDHTVIPDSIWEWELQEKARVILDAGDNDPDSVLEAAALFQD